MRVVNAVHPPGLAGDCDCVDLYGICDLAYHLTCTYQRTDEAPVLKAEVMLGCLVDAVGCRAFREDVHVEHHPVRMIRRAAPSECGFFVDACASCAFPDRVA